MQFIPIAEPTLSNAEFRYVKDCLKSTWISSTGIYIEKFEEAFAHFCQTKYAITCSNGTTALHLALLALGITHGDEVLVPAFTFVATANVVKYVGATPVLIDADIKTWNIDPDLIEEKITKKTRAIIPVHLYGYPAAMKKIIKIARKYNLFVIEDAAEAHGAKIDTNVVGSFGDIGCFSFYGNKIITTGEGGMLVTNSKKLANKIRLLKNHGMSPTRKYFHPIVGYNYRMTNMQAAVGLGQLESASKLISKRSKIQDAYLRNLKKIPGLIFQLEDKTISTVCWLFSMRVTKDFKISRDKLIMYLRNNNIDSRPFFHPLAKLPMFKTNESFPVANQIAKEGINLPSSAHLTVNHIAYISRIIQKANNHD